MIRVIIRRKFSSSQRELDKSIEDLSEFMHGRNGNERKDSITKQILLDRKRHQEKMQSTYVNRATLRKLESIGLGSKKRQNLNSDNFFVQKSDTTLTSSAG